MLGSIDNAISLVALWCHYLLPARHMVLVVKQG